MVLPFQLFNNGGLAFGLLRPYYIEVEDPKQPQNSKTIKYSPIWQSIILPASPLSVALVLKLEWGVCKAGRLLPDSPGGLTMAAIMKLFQAWK